MDDELKAKMLQYLESIEQGVQQAGDFAKAEIPAVASEYVHWYMFDSFISASVLLLISSLSAWLLFLSGKKAFSLLVSSPKKNNDFDFFMLCLMTFLVSACVAVPCFINGLLQARQGYKAAVAPRVIILEKIQELTK